MSIPFVDLKAQYSRLKPEIDRRIAAVMDHGRFILGPEVAEFEATLAAHCGVGHAIGVSSGTDALLIAMMAEGIGPGDAVFVPGFTFTATAEVPLLLGASPVFVDVDDGDHNIDPADLERRIREVRAAGRLRPRAIIAVDLFGLPADYRNLVEIADRHGLFLLADAAQSYGGSGEHGRVGTLAPVTACSFFPAKPLGCYGDGGALLTDDRQRADAYRSLRAHGTGGAKYDIVRLGLNARLDTIQAAVLLAKLPVLDEEIEARRQLAEHYDSRIGNLVRIPERRPGRLSAWAQYTIQVDHRDRVASKLAAAGIPTAVYYPRPMHLQPAYLAHGGGTGSLPVSEALSRRVLSLPMHGYMPPAIADRICAAVVDAAAGAAG